MEVGAVTRSFPELTNNETAELLAANGFRWTELCFSQTDSNYWVYNGRSDLSALTDARSEEIVAAYRNAGVEVAALGIFTNVMHRDAAERNANLGYFERMMQIAAHNGIPVVSTECGFVEGSRGINDDYYERDFAELVNSFRTIAGWCDRYDLDVALEACVLDVVPSAKRARDFISQVGSDRVKILLDPANLIANSSESDMFAYLAPHIAYIHGKDRKVNDRRGRIVGDGDIDWPQFLALYHRYAESKPFILEYVNRTNFTDVRDRVLAADAIGASRAPGRSGFDAVSDITDRSSPEGNGGK